MTLTTVLLAVAAAAGVAAVALLATFAIDSLLEWRDKRRRDRDEPPTLA